MATSISRDLNQHYANASWFNITIALLKYSAINKAIYPTGFALFNNFSITLSLMDIDWLLVSLKLKSLARQIPGKLYEFEIIKLTINKYKNQLFFWKTRIFQDMTLRQCRHVPWLLCFNVNAGFMTKISKNTKNSVIVLVHVQLKRFINIYFHLIRGRFGSTSVHAFPLSAGGEGGTKFPKWGL